MTRTNRLALVLVAWLGAAMFTVLGAAKHSPVVSWTGGLWSGAALVMTLLYLARQP